MPAAKVSTPAFDYPAIIREQMVGIPKRILMAAARNGFPQDSTIYITFQTSHPGCRLPAYITENHPSFMVIWLEDNFQDLTADASGFTVTLVFGERKENIRIAYDAILNFRDCGANIDISLQPAGHIPVPAPDNPKVVSLKDYRRE